MKLQFFDIRRKGICHGFEQDGYRQTDREERKNSDLKNQMSTSWKPHVDVLPPSTELHCSLLPSTHDYTF